MDHGLLDGRRIPCVRGGSPDDRGGSTQYGKRDRHRRPAAAHQQVRPDGSHGASPSGIDDLRRKGRSEEHTSELQSLMRISYAVFCLKKKNTNTIQSTYHRPDCNPIINNRQAYKTTDKQSRNMSIT